MSAEGAEWWSSLKSICGWGLVRKPKRLARRSVRGANGALKRPALHLGIKRGGEDRRRGGVCFVRRGRRGGWWLGGRSGRSRGGRYGGGAWKGGDGWRGVVSRPGFTLGR